MNATNMMSVSASKQNAAGASGGNVNHTGGINYAAIHRGSTMARKGSVAEIVRADGSPVTSFEPGGGGSSEPHWIDKFSNMEQDVVEEASIKMKLPPGRPLPPGKGVPRLIEIRTFDVFKCSGLDLIHQAFSCEVFIQVSTLRPRPQGCNRPPPGTTHRGLWLPAVCFSRRCAGRGPLPAYAERRRQLRLPAQGERGADLAAIGRLVRREKLTPEENGTALMVWFACPQVHGPD